MRPLDAVSIPPPPPRTRASRVRHQPPTTPSRPVEASPVAPERSKTVFTRLARLTIPLPPLPTLRLDPASEERELEHVVRRALQQVVLVEKHPRLGLLVVLQVVSDDGGVEACAMNAASAAIMDAAVPGRCVLCAAAS